MDEQKINPESQRLDRAMADRLAKLGAMPVDTSRLAKRVEAQVPRRNEPQRSLRLHRWMRPVRAVAASLLILGLIAGIIISSSSGPAMASTRDLLRVHQEVIAGTNHAVAVQSIASANSALARQWPGAPPLPQVSGKDGMSCCVMSCCVHQIGHQKIACAAMTIDGAPVSMTVADAHKIKMPRGKTIERDGASYVVDADQGVNMVMTERNGRWACLMGQVTVEKLLDTLGGLHW
jgi:hypothetical protein